MMMMRGMAGGEDDDNENKESKKVLVCVCVCVCGKGKGCVVGWLVGWPGLCAVWPLTHCLFVCDGQSATYYSDFNQKIKRKRRPQPLDPIQLPRTIHYSCATEITTYTQEITDPSPVLNIP